MEPCAILLKLISKGAEADIYLTQWNGRRAVLKIRKRKEYRNQILDDRIRAQRTVREARMISEVKSVGVSTPLVYFVDQKKFEIYMQFVEGRIVRDLPEPVIVRQCEAIGYMAGTLHRSGFMHGDLTTSNFILSGKKLVAIDFGLAQRTERTEDHAIDLRLFKEVLNSAHVGIVDRAWPSFLRGYGRAVGLQKKEQVLSQVTVIEGRGRYANVV